MSILIEWPSNEAVVAKGEPDGPAKTFEQTAARRDRGQTSRSTPSGRRDDEKAKGVRTNKGAGAITGLPLARNQQHREIIAEPVLALPSRWSCLPSEHFADFCIQYIQWITRPGGHRGGP